MELDRTKKTCYLLTDSNIDLLKVDTHSRTKEFVDSLFDYKFLEIITKVTRSINGSVSLIDHIITNSKKRSYICGIFHSIISDHFPTFHILSVDKKAPLPKYIAKRDFSEENMNNFCNSLFALTWENVLLKTDAQEAYDTFWEVFKPLFDIQFPLTKVKFNKNYHRIDPWITMGILTSRRQKYHLRDIYLKSPNNHNKVVFRNFKNLYNRVVRNSKKMYYEKQFDDNKNNIKKTWALLREVTKKPKITPV